MSVKIRALDLHHIYVFANVQRLTRILCLLQMIAVSYAVRIIQWSVIV